jgi:hypothetical protein
VADNAGPNRLISIVYTDVCYNTTSTPFTSDGGRLQHALGEWPDLTHCDHPADPGGDLRPLYFAQVAKGLAKVPGHKVVVLFVPHVAPSAAAGEQPSESLFSTRRTRGKSEKNAGPHQDPFDMELEFRKADVSVYPVEAQAGVATPGWALDLAEATGGSALSRGSDGLGVFDPLTREQDESYTLAYSPASIRGRKLPYAQGHGEPARRESGRAKPVLQRRPGDGGRRQAKGERVRTAGGVG